MVLKKRLEPFREEDAVSQGEETMFILKPASLIATVWKQSDGGAAWTLTI
ncbi:MAG: hypothetical protein NTZ78_08120 [Candidatus Aureabacteria bacterium]|nr:hypothetical protein [Candidatus Auribacterota bacterium]